MASHSVLIVFTAYLWRDLHQCSIIAAEGHNEQHGLNAIKAAEPLPPLAALAPNVVQPVDNQN